MLNILKGGDPSLRSGGLGGSSRGAQATEGSPLLTLFPFFITLLKNILFSYNILDEKL